MGVDHCSRTRKSTLPVYTYTYILVDVLNRYSNVFDEIFQDNIQTLSFIDEPTSICTQFGFCSSCLHVCVRRYINRICTWLKMRTNCVFFSVEMLK